MFSQRLASPGRLLVSTLLFLLFAATATAQIPGPNPPQIPEPGLTGEWDLLNPDGSFPIPDADIGVNIHINPDGTFTGEVWIDKGNGPTTIDDEELTIYNVGPGQYVWENGRGTHGLLIWDPYYGHYESLVLTGPNRGTKRILVD